MSQDKPLTLEQARKQGKLDEFAKDKPLGNEEVFDALMDAMAKGTLQQDKKKQS